MMRRILAAISAVLLGMLAATAIFTVAMVEFMGKATDV